MLILTRRKGKSIIIGDDIEVKILELHGSQVKIGVQAPRSLSVHRKEVYDRIQKKKEQAAETGEQQPPNSPPDGKKEG